MFGQKTRCPVRENEFNWVLRAGKYFFDNIEGLASRELQTVDPAEFLDFRAASNEEGTELILKKLKSLLDINMDFALEFEDSSGHSKVLSNIPHESVQSKSAAGRYIADAKARKIQINESNFKSPLRLVATIAHELCHYKLIEQFGLDNHDEELTDLLPVFFGLGAFSANSVVSFSQWTDATTQGWSIDRVGYLSEEVLAFSTALASIFRGEDPKKLRNTLLQAPKNVYRKTVGM